MTVDSEIDVPPAEVIDAPPAVPTPDPEAVREILVNEPTPPPPELVDAVLTYFSEQRRQALLEQVRAIERVLGFLEHDATLAARIARIEQFLGLKG